MPYNVAGLEQTQDIQPLKHFWLETLRSPNTDCVQVPHPGCLHSGPSVWRTQCQFDEGLQQFHLHIYARQSWFDTEAYVIMPAEVFFPMLTPVIHEGGATRVTKPSMDKSLGIACDYKQDAQHICICNLYSSSPWLHQP